MLTIIRQEGGNIISTRDATSLPALINDQAQLFWLDLESPTPDELNLLSEVFHFHPIAVEDASRPHQRPKVDEYEGYFFLTADEVTLNLNAPEADSASKEPKVEDVQSRQMSMFLGVNYLVTIHIAPVATVRNLRDRCDHNRRLFGQGGDYLLYALLDVLVDGYFPILDTFDESMDDLEDRVVGRPEPGMLETIFRMKHALTRLRRFVGPLREVLQTLTSRDFPNIQTRTIPYLRDVADHLFRIYEMLDGYRDLMSNMLDAYLSQVANEMNRVMQRLAVVGTVFLPLTFITGVFGMNFVNQPWMKTSFWFWIFFMVCIAVLTLWWFHRRHWV